MSVPTNNPPFKHPLRQSWPPATICCGRGRYLWSARITAMRRILFISMVALIAIAGCANNRIPPVRSCYHQNESVEIDIGFCQALRDGDTLYISGTAGQGDMSAAVRSVYKRLDATLAANGLSFADVVKENVYTTDLDAFIKNKDIRKEFYGRSLPAASWVQVQRLYLPSFVVEIELTARISK